MNKAQGTDPEWLMKNNRELSPLFFLLDRRAIHHYGTPAERTYPFISLRQQVWENMRRSLWVTEHV